jgi:hypothetical protein
VTAKQARRPASAAGRQNFEFVISMKTARTLGIEMPLGLHSVADDVIE